MNNSKIRFLKNLSTVLVLVAVVFAFLIAGIRVFGVQVYGVLTGSMAPAIPTGSMIYVTRVDTKDLRVNDVITFSISPNVIATHRIVEVVHDETSPLIVRYRTKGDANNDVDASLVTASNVIGKVMFSIPFMGYIANYIQQPPGIYVAILVCGLMIAFVFYTDSLENKRKRAANASGTPQVEVQQYYQPQQPMYYNTYTQPKSVFQQGASPQKRTSQKRAAAPAQYPYPQQAEFGQYRAHPQRAENPYNNLKNSNEQGDS